MALKWEEIEAFIELCSDPPSAKPSLNSWVDNHSAITTTNEMDIDTMSFSYELEYKWRHDIATWQETRVKTWKSCNEHVDPVSVGADRLINIFDCLSRSLFGSRLPMPSIYAYRVFNKLPHVSFNEESYNHPWHLVGLDDADLNFFVYCLVGQISRLIGSSHRSCQSFLPLLTEESSLVKETSHTQLKQMFKQININVYVLTGVLAVLQHHHINTVNGLIDHITDYVDYAELLADPLFEALQVGCFNYV